MDETYNALFTHAKMEYTAQLIDVLAANFFDGIKSIYDESKTVHQRIIRIIHQYLYYLDYFWKRSLHGVMRL